MEANVFERTILRYGRNVIETYNLGVMLLTLVVIPLTPVICWYTVIALYHYMDTLPPFILFIGAGILMMVLGSVGLAAAVGTLHFYSQLAWCFIVELFNTQTGNNIQRWFGKVNVDVDDIIAARLRRKMAEQEQKAAKAANLKNKPPAWTANHPALNRSKPHKKTSTDPDELINRVLSKDNN